MWRNLAHHVANVHHDRTNRLDHPAKTARKGTTVHRNVMIANNNTVRPVHLRVIVHLARKATGQGLCHARHGRIVHHNRLFRRDRAKANRVACTVARNRRASALHRVAKGPHHRKPRR